MNLKTIVRTAQVNFPSLLEFRHAAQRAYYRFRRMPVDPDFRFLSLVRFERDEIMIDIGANRGQSIDAMRLYHPGQPIVAFEPNQKLATRLRSMFASDPNIRVEPFGVGDESGEFTLHIPSYNGWDFDGQAALTYQEENMSYLQSSILGFDPSKLVLKSVNCKVRCLDEFSIPAGFIKIDTEGFELHAIRGAVDTLKTHRPILMIENSFPAEITSELGLLGYSPFQFDGKLKPGIGVRNTIYLHHSKRDVSDTAQLGRATTW